MSPKRQPRFCLGLSLVTKWRAGCERCFFAAKGPSADCRREARGESWIGVGGGGWDGWGGWAGWGGLVRVVGVVWMGWLGCMETSIRDFGGGFQRFLASFGWGEVFRGSQILPTLR